MHHPMSGSSRTGSGRLFVTLLLVLLAAPSWARGLGERGYEVLDYRVTLHLGELLEVLDRVLPLAQPVQREPHELSPLGQLGRFPDDRPEGGAGVGESRSGHRSVDRWRVGSPRLGREVRPSDGRRVRYSG